MELFLANGSSWHQLQGKINRLQSFPIYNPNFHFSLVPSEIQVRVGSVDWASGGQVMPVKNILQTEFVSFIILDKDMTFGPTVKAVKFTDQPSSEEFTKLQVVGWGYPSIDDNIRTDSMYVQNLPVMNQDDCESENGELFDEIPEYVPLYCLAERSTYGMFDLAIVPVFKNGAVEAFAIGREEDTTSILLVHAQFVYHEMKMTLNAMQGIS